jgi:excisionase family DNA binding protein
MSNQLLTIQELADELQVPVQTVYLWRSLGKGPRGARIGKHVRYRRADVDAWLEKQMDEAR